MTAQRQLRVELVCLRRCGLHAHSSVSEVLNECSGRIIVEGYQDGSVGSNSFRKREAIFPFNQWRRQLEVQVVLLEPTLRSHLNRVPETRSGDKGGASTGTSDESVGGQRGSVDKRSQVGQVRLSIGDQGANPVKDTLLSESLKRPAEC